jgi:hypothetical protein
MLRAYAAWAERTAEVEVEVDVEAIKRSMNASEAPTTPNLAVNLSVAEALQMKRALAIRSPHRTSSCAHRLFRRVKLTVNQTKEKLAGVEGLFGPAGLTPSGPPSGCQVESNREPRNHDAARQVTQSEASSPTGVILPRWHRPGATRERT